MSESNSYDFIMVKEITERTDKKIYQMMSRLCFLAVLVLALRISFSIGVTTFDKLTQKLNVHILI